MATTITDKALKGIKESNRLIARLMIHFDRGQNTIENWMNTKNPMHAMLTTADAVRIIKEETGLAEEEILTEEGVKVATVPD